MWEYFQQAFQGVLNILDLWIVMLIFVPAIYVFTHWLAYGLKDLENVDYYCPDCKAKSNYELSASEKCQQNVKYVDAIFVCVHVQFFSLQLIFGAIVYLTL